MEHARARATPIPDAARRSPLKRLGLSSSDTPLSGASSNVPDRRAAPGGVVFLFACDESRWEGPGLTYG